MKDTYEDIINLKYQKSDKYPPMPLIDRAAQFAPFSALTGYSDVVDETTNSLANLLEIVEYANSLCPIRPVEVVWRERKEMYGY